MKKVLKKVISLMPQPLRFELNRRAMNLPTPTSTLADFEFKVAETEDEFFQSLQILHDSYVKAGFMDADPSGLRVTPYHCLPATTTFLALHKGKVIATMSVVKDSPFGLPMQKIYDLSSLRSSGQRIAEVSALAIRPDFRGQSGQLLFLFIRYMWLYSYHRLGIDRFVITVNPAMAEFYQIFLNFQNLAQQSSVDHYDFVKGAPANGQFVDLKGSHQHLQKLYEGRAPEKNLYKFIFESSLNKDYLTENRSYFLVPRKNMAANLRRLFLTELTSVWQNLKEDDRKKMAQSHDLKESELIFSEQIHHEHRSRSMRIEVECPLMQLGGVHSMDKTGLGNVYDVSHQGFKVYLKNQMEIELGIEQQFKIALGPDEIAIVVAIPMWKNGNTLGMKITKTAESWTRLMGFVTETPDKALRAVG